MASGVKENFLFISGSFGMIWRLVFLQMPKNLISPIPANDNAPINRENNMVNFTVLCFNPVVSLTGLTPNVKKLPKITNTM